jgi:hypothetical protein
MLEWVDFPADGTMEFEGEKRIGKGKLKPAILFYRRRESK